MKNICFLNGSMSRTGGTERCTAIIANGLCEQDNLKIIIVDISNKDEKCFFQISDKVNLLHIHPKNICDGICKLRRIIKLYRINFVISVEAMLGIYSIPAAMFKKTENIIWEHGNFFQKQCRTIDMVRLLEIKLCKNYITLTKRDRDNFEKHFKGRCEIDYIYNPIVLPDYEVKYDVDSKRILTVGEMWYIKGFDLLIIVAEIVLKKHKDWIWEIYGHYNEQEEYVRSIFERVKQSDIADRLIIKGVTRNISSKYDNSGILVMTSRMEGLPMTLLEAKSHKLPIVSFDIETGPSEIVQDGVNGYLIKPYDTNEMAEKICKLIEDGELRQSFSDNAYVGIEKFDIDRIMDKWIELIEE